MKKIAHTLLIVIVIMICTIGIMDTAQAAEKKKKIGLALGTGGLGDQSYNDMQYKGLLEVAEKFDVDITYKVPGILGAGETLQETTELYRETLRVLAEEENSDFIIIAGYEAIEPLDEIASKYPNKKFVLLDGIARPRDNVASILYAQHEGSFVVGALAVYVSQTKKIGFIGGVDIPVIKAFLIGFKEGIASINPDIQLVVNYVSFLPDFSGFEDPLRGYELANRMYANGVDVIYSVAGGTGNGIIKAANMNQKYVIGVDANQDHLAPGFVLTSMMKRLDVSVFDICKQFLEGMFEGNKVYEYGYKNGGVSITEMEFTKDKVPAEALEKIRSIEQKIARGEISVTNAFTEEQ